MMRDVAGRVEINVYNAGFTRCDAAQDGPGAWDDMIAPDFTACFNMCRVMIGDMHERVFGPIVNISSFNGQQGRLGQTSYAAPKAGILGFTKELALKMASKRGALGEIDNEEN